MRVFIFFIYIALAPKIVAADNEKHVIGVHPAGFFSAFTGVLNQLSWCQKNNKIPVVYWDIYSFYYNPNGLNGSYNAWEYYFEPVSSLKYELGDIIHYGYSIGPSDFYYASTDQSKRDHAYRLISKYIKINKPVQQKIDQFYQENMINKNTIGIHLRGTDKYKEESLISAQQMIETALLYADADTQFLIATDEQQLLDTLISLLKDHKVIYYDCYRSTNGQPLHSRKPYLPQIGEDVLVEVQLLSKCNIFIHTLSNVSAGVLYFNPHLKHVLVR